jgi:hypothetical protein
MKKVILKLLLFNQHQNKVGRDLILFLLRRTQYDSDSGLVCVGSQSKDSNSFKHHSRNNQNQWKSKCFWRRCREQRLKEQYQSRLTADDEPTSELKQDRYWTRQ